LSNNEEIIKLILNIFCDLCKNLNINDNPDLYKNSKTLPNFYKLENIDYLIKIIFENDLNVLSGVGAKSYFHIDSPESSGLDLSIDMKESVFKRQKSIILENPRLIFNADIDNEESNPIYIIANKSPNLFHLKQVYDIISSDITRNVDNFTKYIILKIKSRADQIVDNSFKISTADLCWISFITDQEYLIKFLSKTINWKFLRTFSVPLWIKNEYKLKELLENCGRNEYKSLRGDEVNYSNNYVENVALWFYLAGKNNIIFDLLDKELHNSNVKKFLQKDFSVAKNRKFARENGDDLRSKKKYLFACYFYLLADDIDVYFF
jgi:hypothetical protein